MELHVTRVGEQRSWNHGQLTESPSENSQQSNVERVSCTMQKIKTIAKDDYCIPDSSFFFVDTTRKYVLD